MKSMLGGLTADNLQKKIPDILEFMNPKKIYELKLSKSKRSVEISTRLHGHLTFIARNLQLERNYVYFSVLLKATEVIADGGSPYPYVIIPRKILNPISMEYEILDLPIPLRTSNRTNKEILTALFAAELFWAESGGVGPLPEKYDKFGRGLE